MTREGAIKHKEVILAFMDGADIEYQDSDSNEWYKAPTPQFYSDTEYRVKPKEEIIPMDFSDAERLIGKVIKNKDSNSASIIVSTLRDAVYVGNFATSYEALFEYYEFLDGSPIGKLSK